MHRHLRIVLGFAFAALFAAGAASAEGLEGREEHQRDRIRAGVADGSLTQREARGLAHQQLRTERLAHRLRRDDGVLGPRERARLDQRLDRSSARIHRQRHDRQTR